MWRRPRRSDWMRTLRGALSFLQCLFLSDDFQSQRWCLFFRNNAHRSISCIRTLYSIRLPHQRGRLSLFWTNISHPISCGMIRNGSTILRGYHRRPMPSPHSSLYQKRKTSRRCLISSFTHRFSCLVVSESRRNHHVITRIPFIDKQ